MKKAPVNPLVAMQVNAAVAKLTEREHATNPVGWHLRRPSLKRCPFDDECTALPRRSS